MENIISALSGAIIGMVVGYLLWKIQKGKMHLLHEQEKNWIIAEKESEKNLLLSENEKIKALLDAKEQAYEQAMKAQHEKFDEITAKVSAQMKSATEEMLKQRQKEFAESSSTSLGQIVNPLKSTIEDMRKVMDSSTLSQTEMNAAMRTRIEEMMKQSQAAKESADELARVFRHQSKVQGDWGETILDELLESQGLTRGIHYDTQSTIRDENGDTVRSDDGRIMRPDIILHLDQKRELIIDSKVSLSAFIDYVNASSEEEKQIYLKAHIESISKHVKELAAKDYSAYIQAPKVRMNYVIMFVPHTGALWTALNSQPDLWRKAMDKNVFIADEQTLFAALKIIDLTWTHITQLQNQEKVYALANEILDRVGQFMTRFNAVGKALKNAQVAFEESEKKLQPSGQSILQTCGKLQKLGAKQSSKNPIPSLSEWEDDESSSIPESM